MSLQSHQLLLKRFQDGGNLAYCSAKSREVNILVHWSDPFQSLHDTRVDWLFYYTGYVFLGDDISVSLLMRCNRNTVILSLCFLVVVLVSVNILLLTQLQSKERFSRKQTLLKVRSLGFSILANL